MGTPNQQLESGLVQFASQHSVTSDQAAQLRAVLMADASLLGRLNQDAASGQLNGFNVQSSGGAPCLTGTYDKQAGVVTIPASSLEPTGTTPSVDLKAVVQIQEMSLRFAHSTYQDAAKTTRAVTQDMVDNLQSTLNGSPVLATEMKTAVTIKPPDKQAHLEHFAVLDPGFTAGATYDGSHKTVNLPALGLQTGSANNPQGRFDIRDMTFVLAHEVQHGFDYADRSAAQYNFALAVRKIAQTNGPVHDYTKPIGTVIQSAREDEAKAEIAGWNALLSREKQSNPSCDLDDMQQTKSYRVLDFIRQDVSANPPRAVAQTGLTFNVDNTLSQTPANITAMGQHYFNRPDPAHALAGQRPVHLGERGTSDYPNYTATSATEYVIQLDRKYAKPYNGVMPRLTINMAAIGLKESLLEQEGIDLGKIKTPQPYYDSGQVPAALHHFEHTQDGSQSHQYVPIARSPGSPSLLTDPMHRDHGLYAELKQRLPPGTSEDRMAQITLAAKNGGVRAGQVDQIVVQGEAVFITGKTPGDWAKVNLAEPPISQQDAMRQMDSLDQQKSQQVAQWQQQGQQQNQLQANPGL